MALPPDEDLLDELSTVRLRESSPGVYRLDHDSGQHDDRAVSLGLAALALTERPDSDYGAVTSPARISLAGMRAGAVPGVGTGSALTAACTSRASRGILVDLAKAQRAQTPLQRRHGIGLVVPGSANDPARR